MLSVQWWSSRPRDAAQKPCHTRVLHTTHLLYATSVDSAQTSTFSVVLVRAMFMHARGGSPPCPRPARRPGSPFLIAPTAPAATAAATFRQRHATKMAHCCTYFHVRKRSTRECGQGIGGNRSTAVWAADEAWHSQQHETLDADLNAFDSLSLSFVVFQAGDMPGGASASGGCTRSTERDERF